MWGDVDLNDIAQVSRHVQFAYHLFPLFFFDHDFKFDSSRIVELHKTQNSFGGFESH